MRQIFSSQRVETVEGVAELLRGHGIEVKVTNGRSYKTRRRGQFSYTDLGNASAYPAVWIVRADDQPRALAVEQAELLIGERCGLLDDAERADDWTGEAEAIDADAEILERPLCLRAPQPIGRHLDIAEGVVLEADPGSHVVLGIAFCLLRWRARQGSNL